MYPIFTVADQSAHLPIRLFHLLAVKKVEYRADRSEWSTRVNCCQGIFEKMDENLFVLLFFNFYSTPHMTQNSSRKLLLMEMIQV